MSTGKGTRKDTPTAHAATSVSSSDHDLSAATPDTLGSDQTGPATIDDHLGQTIADRYRILSVLGRGGMGTVYLGEHIQLKKRVALKLLADELQKQPTLVQRFLKEARAAAQIGHPNIVDVSDLGELPGGGAFIAMALLEGEDLQTELARSGPMPAARARHIVGQICRALAAAHGKGIIHRDMKPANVFVARDADGTETVKVLDFGIAQVQEPTGEEARLTQTGAIVGTPAFMSPEQGRGDKADHRADIYSVGCILYNLLTDEVPFDANTLMGVITKHLLEPPVPPSQRRPDLAIAPEMDAIVLRAMEKDPAARFQTMKELWGALEASSTDSPMEWPDATSGRYARMTPVPDARTPSPPSMVSAPRAMSRTGLWVSLAAVLLGGAAVVFLVLRPAGKLTTSVPATPGAATATAPSATAPAATAPTAPPLASEVTIGIRSVPPGALVWLAGKQVGATPFKLTRARSSDELSVRVTLAGHTDETLVLAADRDRLIELHMAPTPVVAPPVGKGTSHSNPGTKNGSAPVKKAGRAGDLKDPFSQ